MKRVNLRRVLGGVLLGVGVLYAAVVVAVFALQRRMLYAAPPPAGEPRFAGGAVQRVPGGHFAFHVPAPAGARTLVYLHGNAEQLADGFWLAALCKEHGLGFYGVEYPGYGLASAGSPSERALYEAAGAAMAHLHGALNVPASQVVLVGRSLGSGVAAELASRGEGARLVLISPYVSMPALAQALFPVLPARWLVRDVFDTLSKAPAIRQPVLILHGDADELIPVEMGRTLKARLPNARLVELEGAGHNDVLDAPGSLGALFEFAAAAQ